MKREKGGRRRERKQGRVRYGRGTNKQHTLPRRTGALEIKHYMHMVGMESVCNIQDPRSADNVYIPISYWNNFFIAHCTQNELHNMTSYQL